MKIITEHNIVIIRPSSRVDSETFLPAAGPDDRDDPVSRDSSLLSEPTGGLPIKSKQPTEKEKKTRAEKGEAWDKVKGTWIKLKDVGLVDALLGKVGLGGTTQQPRPKVGVNNQDSPPPPIVPDPNAKDPDAKKDEGMSTTTMVIIGVVSLGLIVGIIALANRGKKK